MGRFIPPLISLMIFLVEYLLVVHILLSMAHGYSEAAPNVQLQQFKIINRRIGFELEQGGILPSIADAPSTPEPSETAAEGPDYIRRMGKEHRHRHSNSDKSVAGGGLIIGGLATAIFATVFCYIRVTRKSSSTTDHHMGSSSSSSTMAVRGSTRTDGTTTSAASSSTK